MSTRCGGNTVASFFYGSIHGNKTTQFALYDICHQDYEYLKISHKQKLANARFRFDYILPIDKLV